MLSFLYSHEVRSTQEIQDKEEPFPTSIRHIQNRNLRAHGSSRRQSRISGYVLTEAVTSWWLVISADSISSVKSSSSSSVVLQCSNKPRES